MKHLPRIKITLQSRAEAPDRFVLRRHRVLRWRHLPILLLLVAGAGGWLWWSGQPRSLLPSSLIKQVTAFTPYFYTRIPGGYSLDLAHSTYNGDALFITLKEADAPAIVITEQPLPQINEKTLLSNGDKVEDANGKATVNTIEGRLVGTMITADHKALILVNAQQSASKNDIIALLQRLQAVKS